MITASVISAICSAAATFLLAAAVRQLVKLRHETQRFMDEHTWLLSNAAWSQRILMALLRELGINADPPPELPRKK